jgi:hypothetical protein
LIYDLATAEASRYTDNGTSDCLIVAIYQGQSGHHLIILLASYKFHRSSTYQGQLLLEVVVVLLEIRVVVVVGAELDVEERLVVVVEGLVVLVVVVVVPEGRPNSIRKATASLVNSCA